VLGLVTFAVVLTVLRMTSNRERPVSDHGCRARGGGRRRSRSALNGNARTPRATEPLSPPARERRHRV
jgi:hypothetical protein